MTTLQESGGIRDEARAEAGTKIWVTLKGLPLRIRLEWPFHQSTSGADFFVLHGDIRLEGSEGLHAPVAVNLSQTVREVMPSLEPQDAEAPVINALRKEVDRRQIEFLKSGKLLPVPFSSRHYDFKRRQWVFGKASDEAMAEFIERKVYWQTVLSAKSPPFDRLKAGFLAKDARNGAPAEASEPKSPTPSTSSGQALSHRTREGWGTRAGLDWRSGRSAVCADDAGAFDGDRGWAGRAGIAADRGRMGGGYSGPDGPGGAIRERAAAGGGRVGEETRVRERVGSSEGLGGNVARHHKCPGRIMPRITNTTTPARK